MEQRVYAKEQGAWRGKQVAAMTVGVTAAGGRLEQIEAFIRNARFDAGSMRAHPHPDDGLERYDLRFRNAALASGRQGGRPLLGPWPTFLTLPFIPT